MCGIIIFFFHIVALPLNTNILERIGSCVFDSSLKCVKLKAKIQRNDIANSVFSMYRVQMSHVQNSGKKNEKRGGKKIGQLIWNLNTLFNPTVLNLHC